MKHPGTYSSMTCDLHALSMTASGYANSVASSMVSNQLILYPPGSLVRTAHGDMASSHSWSALIVSPYQAVFSGSKKSCRSRPQYVLPIGTDCGPMCDSMGVQDDVPFVACLAERPPHVQGTAAANGGRRILAYDGHTSCRSPELRA